MALTTEPGQIENLALKLVGELKKEREERGQFEFLKVAVANPNLGNWLKMKVLAKEPALSAGIEMPFLDDELERVLRANCEKDQESVSGRDYPALILNILTKEYKDEFAPFLKYIKEDKKESGKALTIDSQREARRAVQLANRLGKIIDEYEATGYLEQLKNNKDQSAIYKGEQALVEALEDVRTLRKVFESVKAKHPKPQGMPETIIMFGHTEASLTALQKEMLDWVMQTHEVLWYCPETEMEPREGVKVRIVGAPGIRREVEMVHESILKAVWDHNEDKGNGARKTPVKKDGINFSDIAVLVPDMPKYRPMIESVFEGNSQIPFGLINATATDYSNYLKGFLALMDIARYGLNRTRLFAALDNSCVQRSMGFSQEDVDKWRELADDFGAFDGYEREDSDEKNVSGCFNWSWALKRMRLGIVAEKYNDMELEARDKGNVEKLSEVVESLHRRLSALNGGKALCSSKDETKWPETWAGRLHDIMDEFLAFDKDDLLESQVRAGIVRTLNSLDVIEGEQGYHLPVAFVENAVAGMECAKGGFLHHGVTIGNLRSLAHVPFKRIFVMGLSGGTFPGKDDHSTLDVRNELSDKARTDILPTAENRALFEAAVSSAREELVLSYSRLDLQTEEKMYPSSLVYEELPEDKFEEYPLDNSSHIKAKSSKVESSVASFAEGVKEEPPTAEVERVETPSAKVESSETSSAEGVKEESPSAEVERVEKPSAKDMAAFVRDPFHGYFSRRFKIELEKYRENDLQEDTPLGIPWGNTLWDLEKAMMLTDYKNNAENPFNDEFEASKKTAKVPDNFLGDFARAQLEVDKHKEWVKKFIDDDTRKHLAGTAKEDSLVVICKKYDTNNNITIPPAVVLENFFERLLHYESTNNGENLKFSIRVIDFGEIVQTWRWNIAQSVVKDYLVKIRECYKTLYPSVTYEELRKVLISLGQVPKDEKGNGWEEFIAGIDWENQAKVIESNREKAWNKKQDPGLVVEKSLEKWRRKATGEDLKQMFETMFKLPMSGCLEKKGQKEEV